MTDYKKQQVLPPTSSRLPATIVPKPSLPAMPTGNFSLGFQNYVLDRNRKVVDASAAYYRSRADQARAMAELVAERETLAIAISRLHALPERCQHEYEKGRLSRINELRLLQLQHEHDEIQAKIRLAAAQLQLAQYQPQPEAPPAPPPPPAPTGLTPADVEKVAQAMPELKPETIQSLLWALGGLLAEKSK